RDAAAGAGARRTDRDLCGLPDRRRASVHRVEGTSPRPLQGNTRGRLYVSGRRRQLLAIRAAPRSPLQLHMRRPDGDPPGLGGHGPTRHAVVTAAITVERLAPAGERAARAIGAVFVGAGLFLIARTAGLG